MIKNAKNAVTFVASNLSVCEDLYFALIELWTTSMRNL